MKKKYDILLTGLENGKQYSFDFTVDDSFFSDFDYSNMHGGNISVVALLTKRTESIFITLSISGCVKVQCSRCLEIFCQNIEFSDEIIVSLSDETNFDTNESFVKLERNSTKIDISQFIYEFCDFATPLSSVHPDNKNGDSGCEKSMIEILDKYKSDTQIIDPRWESLNKLLN